MTTPFDVPAFGSAATLRGERRYATVLLADVANSTQLLESMGSEAWVEIMNRVFQIAGSEIYRYGGEIDQFRGDGLVAFFGATEAHENDPERAVLAGLRMQTAVRAYADQLARQQAIALNLRVGINTGEVIVTQVGDRARHFEHTAMGEAVALAARMETAAEPGTVLVSQNTYRLVSSRFDWLSLGEVSVKGVSRPVSVYRPLGYRERAAISDSRRGRESLGGLDSPLVGRQAEFRALQRAVQALRSGRGGIVTVVGEAGIGKSRLVAEVRLREERAAGPSLLWTEGRCLSLVDATAYLPWTMILRQLLGLGHAETSMPGTNDLIVHASSESTSWPVIREAAAERVQARLEERALLRGRVSALGVGEGVAEPGAGGAVEGIGQQEVTRALARILGLQAEGSGTGRSVSTAAADAFPGVESPLAPLARAVSAVVAAVAERYPLVLAFEDLHWADAASLQLLAGVLPLIEQLPLLVICVMRPIPEGPPESADALRSLLASLPQYGQAYTELRLESLVPDEVAEMVANLVASCAGGSAEAETEPAASERSASGKAVACTPASASPATPEALPPPVIESILAASGGNPYYVEEFVRALIDRGQLVCDGVTCRWQAAGPATTEVPDSLRGVLIARMDRLPATSRRCLQVGAVIGRIFSRNLLEAVFAGADADGGATVEDLDDHLSVLVAAQMIRPRLGGRSGAGGGQYIFKHQLMQEAAYNSLLQGERRRLHRHVALALAAHGDAREALSGTLAHHWDAAGEAGRAVPHYLNAGRRAQRAFAHDIARTAFRRALALADGLAGGATAAARLARWRFEALRGLGQVAFAVGQVQDAERAFGDAIAVGRASGLPQTELIRLYHWLGEVLFWQERYDERVKLGKEGLSLLDPDAETVEVALMNQMVAIGHLTQGVRGDFLAYTLRTASFIEKLPYVPELLPAYEHIITAYIMTNAMGKAEAMLAALAERVDLEHDLAAIAAIHRQTAELKLVRGDLQGALDAHLKALALYDRLGDTKHRVWALGDMGWIRLQLGDLSGAAQWLAEMERTAPSLTHYRGMEYMMQGTTILGLATGDLDRAAAAAEALLAKMGPVDPPLRAAWSHYLLGQTHLSAGDHEKAIDHFRSCVRYLVEDGERVYGPAAAAALCALTLAGGAGAVDALPAAWRPAVPWGLVPARPAVLTGAHILPPPTPETLIHLAGADAQEPDPCGPEGDPRMRGLAILTGAWSRLRVESRLPAGHQLAEAGALSSTVADEGSAVTGSVRHASDDRDRGISDAGATMGADSGACDDSQLGTPGEWTWFDPLGDCAYAFDDGLVLRAANGRDLWEANVSAPRIARRVRGDVTLQARVRLVGAATPVIGGLLLYWDPANHLRLTVGDLGPLSVGLGGSADNKSVLFGVGALPKPPGAIGVILRLERIGDTVTALVRPPGAAWRRVGTASIPLSGPLWAGLCALSNIDRAIYHGAFADGTATRFDGIEMAVER